MKSDITILVSSCDKYMDLLEPFSVLFKRNWPDCGYKKMLVTETAPPANPAYIFDTIESCGKRSS